jgi:O-antigen/teichoic acid export membrane protein
MILKTGALFLIPLYTHALTLSEYGILELLYSISAILSGVLGGGLAHATLRFYFEYDEPRDRNAVVTTAFLTSLCVLTPILALMTLGSGPVSRWVFNGAKYSIALNLTYLAILLELLRQIGLAYLRAKEYSILYVAICAAQMVVQVVCNLYTIFVMKLGVQGILLGNCISIAASVVLLGGVIVRECGIAYHPTKLKEMIRYSYPFVGSSLSSVFFSNADRFLLRTFLSLEAVGIYGLVQKFGTLLTDGLFEPFQKSFGAYRFLIMKQGDAAEIQAKALRYLLVVGGVAGIAVAVFSNEIVGLVMHKAYWSISGYVPIIIVATIVMSGGYVFQTGILYAKRTEYMFFLGLFTDAAGLAIAYLLIVKFGLLGACIAVLIKSAISVVSLAVVSQKFYTVEYDYKSMLHVLFATVMVVVAGHLLGNLPIGRIADVALRFVLVGIGAVWIVRAGISRMEIGYIRRSIPRLSGSIR